jgi:hypothetical protein
MTNGEGSENANPDQRPSPKTVEGKTRMLSMVAGVAITRLTLAKLNAATIPLPPIDVQRQIVAEIEAEQALVAANRELIERFEKKTHAVLARVWGDDEKKPRTEGSKT